MRGGWQLSGAGPRSRGPLAEPLTTASERAIRGARNPGSAAGRYASGRAGGPPRPNGRGAAVAAGSQGSARADVRAQPPRPGNTFFSSKVVDLIGLGKIGWFFEDAWECVPIGA